MQLTVADHSVVWMQAEGLTKLVEHNNKKVAEKQLEGLKTELTEMVTQDPPTPVEECLAAIKAKKTEFALADAELVKVCTRARAERSAHFNDKLTSTTNCISDGLVVQHSHLLSHACCAS